MLRQLSCITVWKIHTALASRSSTGRPTGTAAVLLAIATDPTELVLCFNSWLSGRHIIRRHNGCGSRGCETNRARMRPDGSAAEPRKMWDHHTIGRLDGTSAHATTYPIDPGEGMSSWRTPIARESFNNLSEIQMLRTGTVLLSKDFKTSPNMCTTRQFH